MGRVSRERKRKKRKLIDTPNLFQSVNNDPIYIAISKSLHRDGWRNEAALKIGEFALTGRGVYSTKNVRANDLLISLPIESMISIVTMERDAGFTQVIRHTFAEKNQLVTSQSLLAIYLLYLKHHRRKMDYIHTVPTSFSVPYFCTTAERSHIIAPIMEKISNQQQIIHTDFECFAQCFGQLCCSCCNRKYFCDIFTLDEFEWAFFAVNSRSVYFSPNIVAQLLEGSELRSWLRDEPTLALAPFLDLLNHSNEAKTTVEFKIPSEHRGQYELYTAVPYHKYEQIFISYGALDNVKLLSDYGFYLPNNPNDFIEIRASEACVGQYLDRIPYKLKMFVKNNNLDLNLYISRSNGFSHNLKLLIYIVCRGNDIAETFHESELKRTVYGASDKFDISSNECRTCASRMLEAKIQEMESSRQKLNRGRTTVQSTIYCEYLLESIKWMADLRDVTTMCIRTEQT